MLSIIIPTLNEEKVIEKTLKSLRDYKGDYEIIVSDGRSTDRTIEISKKYADKVMVYEGITRQTIAMGRNLGASVAKGEYLLFLDADIYIPDINIFFARAISFFEKDSKLVGYSVYLKVFPEMANFADRFFFSLFNHMFYFLSNILHIGASYGEFQMVRNDSFKKLGGYNEKIAVAEDNEFFKRLAKSGKTIIDSKLIVYHTGRRAHKIGWPRLLVSWWVNQLSVSFLNKSYNSEWKEIR